MNNDDKHATPLENKVDADQQDSRPSSVDGESLQQFDAAFERATM